MTVSRRPPIETGALLPPKIAEAQETRGSIFGLDLRGEAAQPHKVGLLESVYVPARDGVGLALDVVRPRGDSANTKRNTILVMTCYWRGKKGSPSNEYADLFAPHGYAVVVGDVRGTGASFGVWPGHRTRDEIMDYSDVLDWIVAQPWSSGKVVGYGNSYTGNSADWMASLGHPALKGIVPRFVDYDIYEDISFPGGVDNLTQLQWDSKVKNLNQNVFANNSGEGQPSQGVRPVGREAELGAALREHEGAASPPPLQQVTDKDEWLALFSGFDRSPQAAAGRISRSGVPIQNWGSWFDSVSAEGSIRRFLLQSNPMTVIIGPWNHGASIANDPLCPAGEEIVPTVATQVANWIRFADACFNGEAAGERGKVLHYYTLGEGAWKSTRSWPVPATRQRWYMASGSRLSSSPDKTGFDSLQVDPELGDVISNRWETNGGALGKMDKVDYGDRREFGAARLTYTSEPLTRDLDITGHPVVQLDITSTREDGAFFVYLEAVKPDGVSCYLTEGHLRALHRKVWTGSPFSVLGPQHSYLKRDAEPLTPGKPAILIFTLQPISALVPAGYRLRVVLAGSVKDTFANVPADGPPPFLKFHRGPAGCYIDLPIIGR
ncbi:CocE/NonD family hydrolase (plasmid) [Mesorhizobium sp. AR07]|uniref:CocE/NonD family hydrolase n=1 Tax=Mesorhizobium sp. AR07 TaxID=2865838 RepID=UPI00215F144F|nr:CocE/NonD family hydrolase [Mesorhizobium sp. AR07]UVK48633.1 CocE/NonD family hydrolase [Mesorhizobium sp. AR07]